MVKSGPLRRRDRPARHGRPRGGPRAPDAPPGDRRARRTPSARSTTCAGRRTWPTPWGPWSSSTPSTTPRTRSWTSAPSAATSWPARPTSSTGPTWACSGAARRSSRGSTCPKLEPAPEEAPDRLETGTQNHEGIVGAAAAVDFLASLADGPDRRTRLAARPRPCSTSGARRCVERLWTGLGALPGVTPLRSARPASPRTPTRRPSRCEGRPVRGGRAGPRRARASSSRTATSTRPPWSAASATPRTASCARAAPATRPRDEVDRLVEGVAAARRPREETR